MSILGSVLSVIAYAFTLLLLPLFLLPAFIKHRLNLWIHGRRGDTLANAIDSIYFGEQPEKKSMVYWMVEVEGKLGLQEFQKDLLEKSSKHCPKLQRFHLVPLHEHGTTLWRKDPNFNIKNHVRELRPTANSESHLKEIIQEHLMPRFDEDKPPWIILVINTEWGNTVLLFINHHSIIDGVGSMNLLNEVLFDTPGILPQRKTAVNNTCCGAGSCAPRFLESLHELDTEENRFMKKGEIDSMTDQRLEWSKPVTMSDLSSIRQYIGPVTINDIACGVIWEAVSRYVSIKGIVEPDVEVKIAVDIPVSLRQGEDYTPTNSTALIQIQKVLPTVQNDESVVQSIKHFSKGIGAKKSVYPRLLYDIGRAAAYVGSVRSASNTELATKLSTNSSMCISNIGGPRETVHICGRQVNRLIFIPTAYTKSGLTFAVGSYNGELRVTIYDHINVVDVEQFMSLVNQIFQELITKACHKMESE